MTNNIYASIELGEKIKPFMKGAELEFSIAAGRNGVDKYGHTMYCFVSSENSKGERERTFIGNSKSENTLGDSYLACKIRLGAQIKNFIYTAKSGKQYLNFKVYPIPCDGGEYTLAINYKAVDGKWYDVAIGSATKKSFGGNGSSTPTFVAAENAPAPSPADTKDKDDDLPF